MANEIHVDYVSGNTLYAIIRNRAGQVWCAAQQAFENWGTDGHGADDYDLVLADKSGGRYVGDFDTNIPAGWYGVQCFTQAGANPVETDTQVSSCDIIWTGTAEVTAIKMLANKAVRDHATGTIDYYDDDGSSVILSHTSTDDAVALTRAPN
jgi:hypothetical protein